MCNDIAEPAQHVSQPCLPAHPRTKAICCNVLQAVPHRAVDNNGIVAFCIADEAGALQSIRVPPNPPMFHLQKA